MYLSRLILNARSREVRRDLGDCHELHRTILRGFPDLSDDPSGDPSAAGGARARLGVLYRVETHPQSGAATVLVQSVAEPDWRRLPDGYVLASANGSANASARASDASETKRIDVALDAIRTGDVLVFRLRANPTKRLPPETGADGVRRDGKRVELRDEAAQLAWLRRKGEAGGFEVLLARAQPGLEIGRLDGRLGQGGAATPAAHAQSGGKVVGRALRATDGGAARRQTMTFGDVLFEGRLRVADAGLFRQTLEQGIGSGKAYGFGLLSVTRGPG